MDYEIFRALQRTAGKANSIRNPAPCITLFQTFLKNIGADQTATLLASKDLTLSVLKSIITTNQDVDIAPLVEFALYAGSHRYGRAFIETLNLVYRHIPYEAHSSTMTPMDFFRNCAKLSYIAAVNNNSTGLIQFLYNTPDAHIDSLPKEYRSTAAFTNPFLAAVTVSPNYEEILLLATIDHPNSTHDYSPFFKDLYIPPTCFSSSVQLSYYKPNLNASVSNTGGLFIHRHSEDLIHDIKVTVQAIQENPFQTCTVTSSFSQKYSKYKGFDGKTSLTLLNSMSQSGAKAKPEVSLYLHALAEFIVATHHVAPIDVEILKRTQYFIASITDSPEKSKDENYLLSFYYAFKMTYILQTMHALNKLPANALDAQHTLNTLQILQQQASGNPLALPQMIIQTYTSIQGLLPLPCFGTTTYPINTLPSLNHHINNGNVVCSKPLLPLKPQEDISSAPDTTLKAFLQEMLAKPQEYLFILQILSGLHLPQLSEDDSASALIQKLVTSTTKHSETQCLLGIAELVILIEKGGMFNAQIFILTHQALTQAFPNRQEREIITLRQAMKLSYLIQHSTSLSELTLNALDSMQEYLAVFKKDENLHFTSAATCFAKKSTISEDPIIKDVCCKLLSFKKTMAHLASLDKNPDTEDPYATLIAQHPQPTKTQRYKHALLEAIQDMERHTPCYEHSVKLIQKIVLQKEEDESLSRAVLILEKEMTHQVALQSILPTFQLLIMFYNMHLLNEGSINMILYHKVMATLEACQLQGVFSPLKATTLKMKALLITQAISILSKNSLHMTDAGAYIGEVRSSKDLHTVDSVLEALKQSCASNTSDLKIFSESLRDQVDLFINLLKTSTKFSRRGLKKACSPLPSVTKI